MAMKKQKKYRQGHLPHMLLAQQALPNCNSISAECPDAERYKIPLPHLTTPSIKHHKACFFAESTKILLNYSPNSSNDKSDCARTAKMSARSYILC